MAKWLRKLSKRLKRFFGVHIAPTLVLALVRVIGFTCKVKIHGKEHFEKSSCVYVLWHGELAMMPWLYLKSPLADKSLAVIVSQHKDGEVLAKIMSKLKVGSIRGSSTRGGLQALKGAIRHIKNGGSVAITPDGPRGPRHSVADGAVALAKACHAPIVCINCKALSYWQFKSWDKMFIPKPFSRVEFYIQPPKDISSLSKDGAKVFLRSRMLTYAF